MLSVYTYTHKTHTHVYIYIYIYIYIYAHTHIYGAFLVAQMLKNPPAMQETWVQPLGQEDPLEKGWAAHSAILAWRIL